MTAPASKQLGETEDPTQLVPGEVGHVDANVSGLSVESTRIGGLYDAYRSIRIPGWTGLAQLAWEANYEDEGEKWKAYVSLLDQAKSTLSTYSGALEGAQAKAQTAIEKWKEGEAATQRAVTDYNNAVEAYNASVCAPTPTQSPFGHPAPVLRPAPPGPFVDPGEPLRQEAQQILDQARVDLDRAGRTALVELGGLEGSKTEGESDWFGAEGSAEGPSFKWDAWEGKFGKDPSDGRDGRYSDEHEDAFKISLGKVEGEAWVYRAKGSWEDYFGPVKATADGAFTFLGAEGSAEATVDRTGLRLNADGTLSLVRGEGEVGGDWGYAEGTLTGEAAVEASGEGHAIFDTTGAHAGGELFAGARAGGTAEGDVGGVGGSATAEGWAGAGISGDVDLGYDDGTVTIGGSGGIAWGLGGKLGGEVTLDFPEMLDTGGDIVEGIGGWLD